MAIQKADLEKMNELLANGTTISNIAKKYPAYDYWNIYWEVNDHSFLGKKRTITNRIKSMAKSKNPKERKKLSADAQRLLNELYIRLKINSKKLIEIDRTLRKET